MNQSSENEAPASGPSNPDDRDAAADRTAASESAAADPPADPQAAGAPGSEQDPVKLLIAERDRLKDQLLRAVADADNFRKRARRDADEMARKGREELLRELLPVIDNLERATQYIHSGADAKAIGKGVEMVLRLFEDTLARIGGKRVVAVGTPFDPGLHEAIAQIESENHPAGVVAREELAGYMLGDRLVRPAMVVVSKGATAASAAPASSGGGDEPLH